MQDAVILSTVVYFAILVLVPMDNTAWASFIGKVHPNSQNTNVTARHDQISEDSVPRNRTVQMSLGATAVNASSKPKKKTITALSGQSSTETNDRRLIHGSCQSVPYRTTVRHAVSSTVTCSRRYVVNMCLGYCKSYMAPSGRKAKVNCFCCRGKTVRIKVPLHCGDYRVIKQVPTVDKCDCRPCSLV